MSDGIMPLASCLSFFAIGSLPNGRGIGQRLRRENVPGRTGWIAPQAVSRERRPRPAPGSIPRRWRAGAQQCDIAGSDWPGEVYRRTLRRARREATATSLRRAAAQPNSGPSMSVYVDDAIWNWQGLKWAHLLADDTDELHRFALRLGIHRASYQGPPRTPVPHYDVTSYERRRAIAQGAIACTREEIVIVLRRLRSAGVGRASRIIR
jgi:hypothetical protein